jgi:hypothetical protein
MRVDISASVQGPLFKPGATNELIRAGQATLRELVELGEQRLDETLRPKPAGVFLSVGEASPGQASTGNYRRNIGGRVSGLSGAISDGGVVYGPWLEGISSRNQKTRFKGYSSFRKTGQWLEKKARSVIKKHIGKGIKRLGGV